MSDLITYGLPQPRVVFLYPPSGKIMNRKAYMLSIRVEGESSGRQPRGANRYKLSRSGCENNRQANDEHRARGVRRPQLRAGAFLCHGSQPLPLIVSL
jgi:hypothetical protein